jgi:hypothetical protein
LLPKWWRRRLFTMKERGEKPGRRISIGVWILLALLIALLAVPFMAMGIALQKSGFFPARKPPHSGGQSTKDVAGETPRDPFGLRASLEKAASAVLETPRINSGIGQVRIETPPASMNAATNTIHQLLSTYRYQYVEAVDQDSIRIIVMLRSDEWPVLANRLQTAVEKDGFIYRGPSSSETVSNQADTMVAEIEVMKKQAK